MKKVLFGVFVFFSVSIVTTGFFVFKRAKENPEQVFPIPYSFKTQAPAIKLNAPILITGDRMGSYLAKFSSNLAATISVNLSKPIKIQSLAKEGYGIHRTIHELSSITQWPQILIYQGASEEFIESTFNLSEINKIKENFKRYNDDRIETLLILYPWLSKIIYEPLKRVHLTETVVPNENLDQDYLNLLDTSLLLYEQQLLKLVKMSRDKNSLLILTTTPINLDAPPKKVCSFTTTHELESQIQELRDLLKTNDPKSAYTKSVKLITKFSGNAHLFYMHGQIAKRLGLTEEAIESLLKASAYDCRPWRATEVYNSIIRKVAKENQVLMFDFAKLLENEFSENILFFDEIHPQNLYYDKGVEQLGLVIKSILKL